MLKLFKNILSASLRRCLYEYTFLVHSCIYVYSWCPCVCAFVLHLLAQTIFENLKNQRFTISWKQTCETIIRMLWIMVSSIKLQILLWRRQLLYCIMCLLLLNTGKEEEEKGFQIEEFVHRLLSLSRKSNQNQRLTWLDQAPKAKEPCGFLLLYRKNMIEWWVKEAKPKWYLLHNWNVSQAKTAFPSCNLFLYSVFKNLKYLVESHDISVLIFLFVFFLLLMIFF